MLRYSHKAPGVGEGGEGGEGMSWEGRTGAPTKRRDPDVRQEVVKIVAPFLCAIQYF